MADEDTAAAATGGSTMDIEVSSRFWCHSCQDEITPQLPDFLCPRCEGGFIEELNEVEGHGGGGGAGLNESADSDGGDLHEAEMMADAFRVLIRGSGRGGGIGGLFASFGGGSGGSRRSQSGQQSSGGSSTAATAGSSASGTAASDQANESGADENDMLGNSLQEILTHLFSNIGPMVMSHGGGRVDISLGDSFNMGNLGDYVTSQDGLDRIITQLLNNYEGGARPATAEEISDKVKDHIVTSKEAKSDEIQCSVCWEVYAADDLVKQLPCGHLYHPHCILPWLKQHNSCPVCRKNLDGKTVDQQDEDDYGDDVEMQFDDPGSAGATSNNNNGPNNGSDERPDDDQPPSSMYS